MSTKLPNALIVCDSNREYGSGHVMRSITLGISLQKVGLKVALVCFEIPEALIERAESFGLRVLKRKAHQAEIAVAAEVIESTDPGDVIVFDGYYFDQQAIAEVHHSKRFVVVIDDNGDLAECASSLILNQNLHANESMYRENRHQPKLLLGCHWALVRPEILQAREAMKSGTRNGVFLAMGGTDPLGITSKILSRLLEFTGLPVVAAGGFLGASTLGPSEMALQMAEAQIGVIACGTTTWEAACLQLPMIGVVAAENQVQIAESLVERKLADCFDFRDDANFDYNVDSIVKIINQKLETRNEKDWARLVDGHGAQRVSQVISDLLLAIPSR